jgi:DNA-binding PadR family transcriptional regulator
MHDLTGFQRDLMYVVAGGDRPNGLTIKSQLEDYYEAEVNHGRLYPNLDDLVDMGLIEKGSKDRRTNYYELTDRGRRELQARREWEEEHLPEAELASA